MKNKYILVILLNFLINTLVRAENYTFETAKIEILKDDNIILAYNGKAVSPDKSIDIIARKFRYNKNNQTLLIEGDAKLEFKTKNYIVNFNKATLYQNKNEIILNDKIIIKLNNQSLEIQSQKIIYDIKNETIKSTNLSKIKDSYLNIYDVDSFIYEISENILKVKNLKFFDKDMNYFETPLAFINTKSGNFFGKDINFKFNKDFFNEKNDPRLYGNSVIKNDEKTTITKGVFTNCKIKDGCPPWEISAKKIVNDKKKS